MIDNAGITKNVSIFYKEYAASIGTTAGKLDEQQKKQAIINGIMNEAALFAGNAEKSMQTYQGRLTKIGTQQLEMKRDMGAFIAPNLVNFLEDINDLMIRAFSNDTSKHGINVLANSLKILVGVGNSVLKSIEFLSPVINTMSWFFSLSSVQVGFLIKTMWDYRKVLVSFINDKLVDRVFKPYSAVNNFDNNIKVAAHSMKKTFTENASFNGNDVKNMFNMKDLTNNSLFENQKIRTKLLELQKNGNLEEAKALVALYNSITLEAIISLYDTNTSYNTLMNTLTGFGRNDTCMLCIPVNPDEEENPLCCGCIYVELTDNWCADKENYKTYKDIMHAENHSELLIAIKQRAKHLQSLIDKAESL
jgi:hypothetical protein